MATGIKKDMEKINDIVNKRAGCDVEIWSVCVCACVSNELCWIQYNLL